MRVYENGTYRDMTAEEIAAMQAEARKAEIIERARPLTAEEVSAMLITAQINNLSVDDNTALRMKSFYPEWAENTAYSVGFKIQRNGSLWRCLTDHTSIVTWEPENAPSLWEQINETHDGTLDDPIPYEGNMALENGKYYMQEYEVYLCTRDTVNPVYHALSDLVGTYVEKAD